MDLKKLRDNDIEVADPVVAQKKEEDELILEGEITQLVTFLLDEVEFGIDILSVHEILRFPEITRLPNTPEFICGVINLRGNVIPVVDIRLRFGLPMVEITELSRIIVIEIDDKLVGFLVDNVYQVVRIPKDHIDSASELIEGVSQLFIKGIGRFHKRLIVIMNISPIIYLEDSEVE